MPELRLNYATLEEVPEQYRQHCKPLEEGGFIYNDDPLHTTVKNLRSIEKENQAKLKQAEELLLRLKNEAPKQEPGKKENEPDPKIAELQKTVETLQQSLQSEAVRRQESEKANYVHSIKGKLRSDLVGMVSERIAQDENGFYVKDETGGALLDSYTGARVKPGEYIKSLESKSPWMFENAAGGTGGAGYGNGGSTLGDPLRIEIKNLEKKAEEARKAGDLRTQMRIIRQVKEKLKT